MGEKLVDKLIKLSFCKKLPGIDLVWHLADNAAKKIQLLEQQNKDKDEFIQHYLKQVEIQTATRLNLSARKRRGLATIYRIVLQNMSDLGVKLNAEQLAEFSEAMCWIREQTKEQRGTNV